MLHRLRYKVHGPGAELNFGLSEAQRAELDALTLEQLLQRYRAIGASRRGRQTRAEVQSQYRGVSWRKGKCKWQAFLSFNGKKHHLGFFFDEREAALAYDRAAFAAKGR